MSKSLHTSYTVTNITLSKMSGINEWDGKKLGSWVTVSLSVAGYTLTILLSFPTASLKLHICLQCTFVEVKCTKGRWLSALAGAAGRGLTGPGSRLAGISWGERGQSLRLIWDSSLLAIPAIITLPGPGYNQKLCITTASRLLWLVGEFESFLCCIDQM